VMAMPASAEPAAACVGSTPVPDSPPTGSFC
jgi:hypothetical protein